MQPRTSKLKQNPLAGRSAILPPSTKNTVQHSTFDTRWQLWQTTMLLLQNTAGRTAVVCKFVHFHRADLHKPHTDSTTQGMMGMMGRLLLQGLALRHGAKKGVPYIPTMQQSEINVHSQAIEGNACSPTKIRGNSPFAGDLAFIWCREAAASSYIHPFLSTPKKAGLPFSLTKTTGSREIGFHVQWSFVLVRLKVLPIPSWRANILKW